MSNHQTKDVSQSKEVTYKGSTLPIKIFNFDDFCANPSICMIAKRASGKSWLVRDILKHFSHLPGGMIISPTERMNQFYGKFIPDSYIHHEYSTEILEKLLRRQKKISHKCIQKYEQGKKVDPRAFLVMDDCLSSKGTWMNDRPVLDIFFNGRHYNLTFILTMQFPLGIKPELRCNFDYIFLLSEDFFSNQKRLYEHYAGMFPSFTFFRQVFLQLTENFGSMVIINRGNRGDILDKVCYYKSNDVNIRSMGCPQYIKYHEKNYDWNWNDSEKFDINKIDKKK